NSIPESAPGRAAALHAGPSSAERATQSAVSGSQWSAKLVTELAPSVPRPLADTRGCGADFTT
ncbi:hypothetical protein JYU34_006264, partial [Plutella xylostella]